VGSNHFDNSNNRNVDNFLRCFEMMLSVMRGIYMNMGQ